jgi:DNA adenine methylase
MPYKLKKVGDGYKVCIGGILEGGLKPITARVGGKVLLKKKIVGEYFPNPDSYSTYVEPFVGGGSIYFYKNKEDHKEVINDIDPDIYTLFKGLQSYPAKRIAEDINGDYTKKDFEEIQESEPEDAYQKFLKTYLVYKLSYFGRGLSFGKPRVNTSFEGYQERLKGVDITKEDYKGIIDKYNKPDTFFYLDPPVRESQGAYKFPAINFVELAKVLHTIKGKFLLSIGKSSIQKELFRDFKVIPITTKYVGEKTKGGQTKKTKEFLVLNYEPGVSGGNLDILVERKFDKERAAEMVRAIDSNRLTRDELVELANEVKPYIYKEDKKNNYNLYMKHQQASSELPQVGREGILRDVLTGGSCCGGSMAKFHKQLERVGLTHNIYMKKAKELAEASGYDPSKLTMAEDGDHKLCYDGICFGKVTYFDYIIYSWLESQGEIPEGTADKKRKAYRARAKKARGDWKNNKLSPNNLAINILW